ncbi:hypothetical protein [Endozoicomonas sp. ONNA2]|uniref:hypothetical protein n=1 Tax=Endozoicomonas sp. ONNA2 TaxID=2828741 RepID=UPI00214816E9|nr:hypothetical protein [Endozoicomonas sp. ONNA2]
MNPTAIATEHTTRAIERYLTDNPDDEPLSTLGMTADGRIVRLARHDECQRLELHRMLEQQLESLMPQELDKSVREQMFKNTLSTNALTLGKYHKKIRLDRQIRNKIKTLKSDYATEFANLNDLTKTRVGPKGQTQTKSVDLANGDCHFSNEFYRTHWKFKSNFKKGYNEDKNKFFLSNVITHQFEWTFQSKHWLLELPTAIARCKICNEETLDVLFTHHKDYTTDSFRKDFLETTVNGKSTVRIARDLGLKIEGLTVSYNNQEVESFNFDETPYVPRNPLFTVTVQVCPDPSVYCD